MSTGIGVELTLILLLVIANGIFSMSELAVVSSRKARLQKEAESGSRKAKRALGLANAPNDFLSTVQVGITLIGTLAGAFGGATIAEKLGAFLKTIPMVAPYSDTVSITAVVLIISYLSLILGELVPKRIALSNPERIAMTIAGPMRILSRIGSPAVRFLSFSTDMVLKLLPLKRSQEEAITEDEVRVMIEQGTKAGTFEPAEEEMIKGVFRLSDRRARELMTPRRKITWLNIDDDRDQIQKKLRAAPHTLIPVSEDHHLDRVVGVVHVKDLLLSPDPIRIRELMKQPVFVRESMPALNVLEMFQTSGIHLAIVIDEHGGVEGLLTLTSILEAIVGDLPDRDAGAPVRVTKREDGSLEIDGSLLADELKQLLRLSELPREEPGGFATVGGFVMTSLGRVPTVGDHFSFLGHRLKVLRMDGNRVDKVLIWPPMNVPEETGDE